MKRNFGTKSSEILRAGLSGAVNPYDHFGRTLRRSWAYGYFTRLFGAGLIEITATPDGRRGTWYQTTEAGRQYLQGGAE